jgi:hypothetical protein
MYVLDGWLNLATLAPQQNVWRAEATKRSALERSTLRPYSHRAVSPPGAAAHAHASAARDIRTWRGSWSWW